jgi:hypothetical protein
MICTVSGKYRCDTPDHSEQDLKEYSVSFKANPKKETPKTVLEKTVALLRIEDGSFDSIKTHKIDWTEDVKQPTKPVESPGAASDPLKTE